MAKQGTRMARKLNYNIAKANLNEEQHEAKTLIESKPVSIITGKAGSGKTFLSVAIGIEKIIQKEARKLYFIRPTVGTEDIGFLKGSMNDKMEPWMQPIFQNIKELVGSEGLKILEDEDRIEILPLQFARGITMNKSYIIVDECQNLNVEQTKMILTRLGKYSQMVFAGDQRQIDLPRKNNSGLSKLFEMSKYIDDIGTFELKQNHRHPVVDKILNYMEGSGTIIT